MNIFNTSPQTRTESIITNEENSLEETQTQIEAIDKRLLEIAAEDRKLEEDIAYTEKNDGSYPQDAQVAGRLRGLRNMRDELAVEKGKLLTEKNELLAKKGMLAKEPVSEEDLNKRYDVSSNEEDFDNALRATGEESIRAKIDARVDKI